MLVRIGKLMHRPWVGVLVGVVMVATALVDIVEELLGDVVPIPVGTHHGLLAMGVFHVLKTIPELVEGVHKIEGGERRPDGPAAG